MGPTQSRDVHVRERGPRAGPDRPADARTDRAQSGRSWPRPAAPPEHKAKAVASKPREHIPTAMRSGPAPVAVASAPQPKRPPHAASAAATSASTAASAAVAASGAASAHAPAAQAAPGVKFWCRRRAICNTTRSITACATNPAPSTGRATAKPTTWSYRSRSRSSARSAIRARVTSTASALHQSSISEQTWPPRCRHHRLRSHHETTGLYAHARTTKPLADGAEDRFRVVMQLSSLVRGSPDTYKPGVVRQFSVADNDSNEIWPIETVGDENVQTADQATWRLAISRVCHDAKAIAGVSTSGLRPRWAGCPCVSCRPNRMDPSRNGLEREAQRTSRHRQCDLDTREPHDRSREFHARSVRCTGHSACARHRAKSRVRNAINSLRHAVIY